MHLLYSNSSGSKETSTTGSSKGGGGGSGVETSGGPNKAPTMPAVHDKYTDLMAVIVEMSKEIHVQSDRDTDNPSLSEVMRMKIR